MENKKIASTDRTYCNGVGCKEFEECTRYKGHYEFKDNEYYSFMLYCEKANVKNIVFGEMEK